ncbi:MAG TPA: energy transducer TonB [Opitutaceae bacterium]|nr:energy transducer TonB [Opitutaceae bacterium]
MNIRLAWLLLLAATPAAFAQNVLVVAEPSGPAAVHAVVMGNSMIEKEGKLVNATGNQYALRKAAVYRRGLIKVSELGLKENRFDDPTGGTLVTFGTDVDCYIVSDLPLKRCFVVLQITMDSDNGIYMSELPDLAPGEQRKIRVSARLRDHLDDKHYALHFFSDGFEVLNSTMTPEYIAEQQKKTDEFMLKQQPDHPVSMARGVAPAVPIYPAELKAQGVTGTAKVSCTIDAHGDVVAVDVVEASNPQFGEALAAAARQWKFEPAVKDHQLVQATAMIPYTFKLPPPPKAEGK